MIFFFCRFSYQIRSPCSTQLNQTAPNGNTIFSQIKLDTVQRSTQINTNQVDNWLITDCNNIITNQQTNQNSENQTDLFGTLLDFWTMEKTMDSFCHQISTDIIGEEMIMTSLRGEFESLFFQSIVIISVEHKWQKNKNLVFSSSSTNRYHIFFCCTFYDSAQTRKFIDRMLFGVQNFIFPRNSVTKDS